MRRVAIGAGLVTALAVAFTLAGTAVASAAVKTKDVEYSHGGTPLKGFLAWDDAVTGKRPGVVIVHEWWGLDERMKAQARKLAEAGYVAFAVDLYGNGKVAPYTHPKDAEAFMNEAVKNPAEVAARFSAGVDQLKQDAHVDATKIAAIGYCLGGGVILHAARNGAPLAAVVSFHGMLASETPAKKGAVKSKILVLTGAADPMAPAPQVAAFKKEMADAGATYEVITYPGAKHAFTNPKAGEAKMDALAYDADADKKSWATALEFLKKALA